MKIIMIGPKQIPSRKGGIDVVVEKLSNELIKFNNKIEIYTKRKNLVKTDKYKITKIPTVNIGIFESIIYSFFATIKAVFSDADVIHFHASGNTLFLWLTKKCNKTIVTTCHGIDWKRSKFKGLGEKLLLLSEKMIVKYSDAIITLSVNDYDYFLNTYGVKTVLIPNGFERFPLSEPIIIKEKYNLTKNDYILFLARIVPEKGLHYLIDAYNKVDISRKLVIAGGDSFAKKYYEEMNKKCANNDKIVLTGHVEGEILNELMSNAYLFVLPSDVEGMSMSLLEAFGHKRVCLLSDIKENHIDDENSYYFEKGNVDSLANALINLDNNRKEYEDNNSLMSWEIVGEKTHYLYKELINEKA